MNSAEPWPQVYITRKGRRVLIRPVRPDDAERMVAFLARLSPETRYRRFHMPVPDPPRRELLRRLGETVDLPPQRGMALIALTDDTIVGSARWVREQENASAEAAVVVQDDYQGEGIGSLLLRGLVQTARAAGVTRLYAYVHPDNRRILDLLRRAQLPTSTRLEGPLMRVEVDISNWSDAVTERTMNPTRSERSSYSEDGA